MLNLDYHSYKYHEENLEENLLRLYQMERHLPNRLFSYVKRESKLQHVFIQAVIVCGRQLTPVRHALNAVQTKSGDAVEFSDYPRVLPIDQTCLVNQQISVDLWIV